MLKLSIKENDIIFNDLYQRMYFVSREIIPYPKSIFRWLALFNIIFIETKLYNLDYTYFYISEYLPQKFKRIGSYEGGEVALSNQSLINPSFFLASPTYVIEKIIKMDIVLIKTKLIQ